MDYYLGEIRVFAGNYAPQDWHLCDGTALPISSNDALYALIGTAYGGDGVTTFKLPDLRGRLPIGQGTGTGLTPRALGQSFGAEQVQLDTSTIPSHTHTMNIAAGTGTANLPTSDSYLAGLGLSSGTAPEGYVSATTIPAPVEKAMNAATISNSSTSGSPHNNVMPVMPISYIICLNGLFPQHA